MTVRIASNTVFGAKSEDNGDLLMKTYYPTPESVGKDADPYAHLLDNQ